MQQIAFELMNGVAWGLVLALISLGLCLIYGLMGIINIAHGSLFMLGAMLGVHGVNVLGFNYWAVLVLAPLAIGLLGVFLNRTVFQQVVHRPPTIGLLATAGLLLIIDNCVLAVFGAVPQSVLPPLPGAVQFFGIYYPTFRLAAAAIALGALLAVWAFLRFTRYGLWMRAVPQARDLAAGVGVPIGRVNDLTVGLAGLAAGLAGALVSPISAAHFQMGLTILAPAFIIVVIGGLGNLFGAVAVAIGYGLIRGIFTTMMTPTAAEAASLGILLPLLYLKPNGIFGGR